MDVKDKLCLVVGGGAVGARKAATLAECGAMVSVVSKLFSDAFGALRQTGKVQIHQKAYESSDLAGVFLVFAATDNAALNQRIKQDAQKADVLCNVADGPDSSDFILPSVVNRGDLIIAVSTCGASPAMAKRIGRSLGEQFGDEYADLLELFAAVREKLLSQGHDPAGHRKIFNALLDTDILERIASGDTRQTDAILSNILGHEYVYEDLISRRSDI